MTVTDFGPYSIIILAVIVVVAILSTLWLARLRRRSRGTSGEPDRLSALGAPVPRSQLPWLGLFVALLLGAFVWAELNKQTWLGGLLDSLAGHWLLRAFLVGALVALLIGWRAFGRNARKPKSGATDDT